MTAKQYYCDRIISDDPFVQLFTVPEFYPAYNCYASIGIANGMLCVISVKVRPMQ